MKNTIRALPIALSVLCAGVASDAFAADDIWDAADVVSSKLASGRKMPLALKIKLDEMREVVPSSGKVVGATLAYFEYGDSALNLGVQALYDDFLRAVAENPELYNQLEYLSRQLKTAETAAMCAMAFKIKGEDELAEKYQGIRAKRAAKEAKRTAEKQQSIVEGLLEDHSREEVAEYVQEMRTSLPVDYLKAEWPEFVEDEA